MNLLHAAKELPADRGRVCVAIGVFDGVHLGHEQVIRQTLADAQQHEAAPVVITFDRHPNTVVAPHRAPRMIYSLPQKLRAIAALGAEHTLLTKFDHAFSTQPAEEYIRGLARDFRQLRSLCVGSEFTFGQGRRGTVELLRQLGAELHFHVHGLAAVALGGQPVSSTRIREAIRHGEFDIASQLLGRAYALAGTVVRGDQLGRRLGFPTANLEVADRELPPLGVYAVHALANGSAHRAVVNIGVRPTVAAPESPVRVEVHLLDFSGDLYGTELEVTFVAKLRAEQRFASPEALRAQINEDVAAARRVFA